MRRAHRTRKDEGLIDMALGAPWWFAAGIAAAIFMGVFVWLPRTKVFSIWGASLYTGARPFAAIALFVFSAIALYKFLQSRRAAPAARSPQRIAAYGSTEAAAMAPEYEDVGLLDPAPEAAATQPQTTRPTEWSLAVLRAMEWKRFEALCLAYYRAKGIRAESTPLGPDGGVDIRLYQDDTDPCRCSAIVQCKAWGDRYVGVAPVRELRGVMAHEGVAKAFFMAPGQYSPEATAFAAANPITLLGGTQILGLLKRLPADVSRRLLDAATAGDWTTPTCPSCGTKMVARESAKGPFWGCAMYPKCRQKLGMRECKT